MPNIDKLDEIIRLALEEDIGSGDVTTLATVGKTRNISGKFIAKQDGIVCGLPVIERSQAGETKIFIIKLFVEEGSKKKGRHIGAGFGRREAYCPPRFLSIFAAPLGIATRPASRSGISKPVISIQRK